MTASSTSMPVLVLSLALLSLCSTSAIPQRAVNSDTGNVIPLDSDASQCQTCREQFSKGDFDHVKATLSDASNSWKELTYNNGKLHRHNSGNNGDTTIKARLCFTVPEVSLEDLVSLLSNIHKHAHCNAALHSEVLERCANYNSFYTVHKFSGLKIDRDFLEAVAVREDTTDGCTTIARKNVANPHATARYPADKNHRVIRGTVNLSGVRLCPKAGTQNTDVCLLVNYDVKELVGSTVADTIARDILTQWRKNLNDCSQNDGKPDSPTLADSIPQRAINELIAGEKDHSAIDGWQLVSGTDKAEVYFKHWVGTTVYAFKSFYKVSVPACILTKILTDYDTRSVWDLTFPQVTILNDSSSVHTLHWLLALPPPFVNRDVLLYSQLVDLPSGGHLVAYINAKHNQRPPHSGVVRATAHPSAIFIRPHTHIETKSFVSYNLHMDLGHGISPNNYKALLRHRILWVNWLERFYEQQINSGTLRKIKSGFNVTC